MKPRSKKKLGFNSSEIADTFTPTPNSRQQSEDETDSDKDNTIMDIKERFPEDYIFRKMIEKMKSTKNAQSEFTA